MNDVVVLKLLAGIVSFQFVSAAALCTDAPLLHCDRERYYEGETVACAVSGPASGTAQEPEFVTLIWSILGKEMKREIKALTWTGKTMPTVQYATPSGLKAVTPLRLEAAYSNKNGPNAVASAQTEVQLFPRDPSYFVDAKEFMHRRIALVDPAGSLERELKYLKVPFEALKYTQILQMKRFDLLLIGPLGDGTDSSVLTDAFEASKGGLPVIALEESASPRGFPFDVALADYRAKGEDGYVCKPMMLPAELDPPHAWGSGMAIETKYALYVNLQNMPKILWYVICVAPYFDNIIPVQVSSTAFLAVSMPNGKGSYTMVQFNLTNHFQDEPLARWWLVQLIRKALSNDASAKEST